MRRYRDQGSHRTWKTWKNRGFGGKNITREIALQAYAQLAYRHRTVVYALNDTQFYRFTFTKNRGFGGKNLEKYCKTWKKNLTLP